MSSIINRPLKDNYRTIVFGLRNKDVVAVIIDVYSFKTTLVKTEWGILEAEKYLNPKFLCIAQKGSLQLVKKSPAMNQ